MKIKIHKDQIAFRSPFTRDIAEEQIKRITESILTFLRNDISEVSN